MVVSCRVLVPPFFGFLVPLRALEVLYTFILLLQTQWRGFQAAQRLNGLDPTDPDFQDWPGAATCLNYQIRSQLDNLCVFHASFMQKASALARKQHFLS